MANEAKQSLFTCACVRGEDAVVIFGASRWRCFCRHAAAMTRYAELAVTTNFSFLRGGSHPRELVATAHALGLAAIGIADRNTFAGVVRAYDEAKKRPEIK